MLGCNSRLYACYVCALSLGYRPAQTFFSFLLCSPFCLKLAILPLSHWIVGLQLCATTLVWFGLFAKGVLNLLSFLYSSEIFYLPFSYICSPHFTFLRHSLMYLGCPQTHYVVQNDLELLNLLSVPPRCWDDRWISPSLAPCLGFLLFWDTVKLSCPG